VAAVGSTVWSGVPRYRQSAPLSARIVTCDETRLPSFDDAALVRHDPDQKLDAVSVGQVFAVRSKRWLIARPGNGSLSHDGHVEASLDELLVESPERKPLRDLDRRITRRWILAEIDIPSVRIEGDQAKQPVATIVGVTAHERAEEVVQDASQDPSRRHSLHLTRSDSGGV
jgi:hypothetical protein